MKKLVQNKVCKKNYQDIRGAYKDFSKGFIYRKVIENIEAFTLTQFYFFLLLFFLNEKLAIPDQHKNDRLKKENVMNVNFT